MKGKTTFAEPVANRIIALIEAKTNADTNTQKQIRQQIRDLGFYAEDFDLRGGYDVQDFLNAVTIDRNQTMEYFTPEEIDAVVTHAGKPYVKNSTELAHFRSVREKLQFFITTHIATQFPASEIVVCRRELINKQAGRGATHNKFTHYILVGCCPAKKSLGRTMFIKFEIKVDTDGVFFKTELDVDYASNKAKATEQLKNYVLKTRVPSLIPFNEIKDLGYEGLLKKISALTENNLALYDQAFNYYQTQQDGVQPNKKRNTMKPELNKILYGPPGTGKTYNTIDYALSLIEDEDLDVIRSQDREELTENFRAYVKSGQIVFTTFHQAMSYEDFIEGIKPVTVKDQVIYEVQDGLFKAFCNRARFVNGNFDTVIEKFKTDISEADGKTPLTIKAPATTFDITYRGTNVFYVQPLNSAKQNPWYPVNIEHIRKVLETNSYEKVYNPTYVREVISYLKKNYGLVKGNEQPTKGKDDKERYVFIIDEINRGNVSQIFGELITLIEADKREGQPEELQIQLPYSKELFSVPDNVYILGTMNTADRSVEALDTALRRRFSFEFMPPDSKQIARNGVETKVNGVSLKQVLDIINGRITYLLDEDHQIGHAYFCSIEPDNVEQLRLVFRNKIIPLLREYFYNDHGKIRLVLGNAFVEKKTDKAPFNVKDEDELVTQRSMYKLRPIGDRFEIIEALKETTGDQA